MSTHLKLSIPSLENKIYFNYGGQGPLPKTSLDAMVESWNKIQELGPFTENVWPYISREIISTKQKLSDILGVSISNIALSENITSGMVLPMWGMRFDDNDELLISDCEHPGIVAAAREFCRRNNIELKIFPIQKIKNLNDKTFLDSIREYITINTKAFIISHVLWNFGFKIPLKKLYEELKRLKNDNYLLIDGAQSFGHIGIADEVKYSDLYAVTSHKWACGPEGLGAVYLSDRFLDFSDPTIIGWKSLKKEQGIYEPNQNILHKDARKFEIATSCTPLLAGLIESINLLEKDCSEAKKNAHICKLSNYLSEELDQLKNIDLVLKNPLKNGIVSFDIKDLTYKKQEIVKELSKKRIFIRIVEDPDWFRVCIHQMTTLEEVDLLIKEIQELIT